MDFRSGSMQLSNPRAHDPPKPLRPKDEVQAEELETLQMPNLKRKSFQVKDRRRGHPTMGHQDMPAMDRLAIPGSPCLQLCLRNMCRRCGQNTLTSVK